MSLHRAHRRTITRCRHVIASTHERGDHTLEPADFGRRRVTRAGSHPETEVHALPLVADARHGLTGGRNVADEAMTTSDDRAANTDAGAALQRELVSVDALGRARRMKDDEV